LAVGQPPPSGSADDAVHAFRVGVLAGREAEVELRQIAVELIPEAVDAGIPFDTFAKLVGVSRQTLYRWRDLARSPEADVDRLTGPPRSFAWRGAVPYGVGWDM
jgi:hypothetical protein